jgi:4-amino-4-deoxy-L-arabinose transferase-like glycosyltransferase
MKKSLMILVLITLLGGILRLYNLGSIPIAITGDEAAIGYNAYALLTTLHDEHGQFMPLIFKSFGDFKSPGFVYQLVPFIYFLGLTEFAIRLPVAIAGVLMIPLVYLISIKMYRNKGVGLLAALFVAISMWGIVFSRGGWEAGMGLFFTTLGIYLFLLGFEKRYLIVLSLLSFGVGYYTYHAEKVTVPILVIALFVLFRKKINPTRKFILVLTITVLVFILPALIQLTNFSGQSRIRGSLTTDYFFNPTQKVIYDKTNYLVNESTSSGQTAVLHPNIILGLSEALSRVYAYISPANLFVYGDPVGRHGVEGFGVLYNYDFILILIAIYFFVRKEKDKYDYFIMIWLISGLLPALVTSAPMHAIRSLLALPAFYIFEGWGVFQFFKYIKNRNYKVYIVSWLIFFCLVLLELVRFSQSYFIYTPIIRAEWWQYGYEEMVQTVMQNQDRFDKVVVESPVFYGNPYMALLFHQKFDPNLYNQTVKREDDYANKVVPVFSFYKYEFREIYWPNDRGVRKTLYVGLDKSITREDIKDTNKFRLIKEIKLPTGEVVFRIVETL